MASTSTNKQPCLIDRPFLRGARITSATTTCNPTNPNLTDLIQLVRVGDLPSEDAALVEDITIVSNDDTIIGDMNKIYMSYDSFAEDCEVGERIMRSLVPDASRFDKYRYVGTKCYA